MAARDIIGERLSLEIVTTLAHYSHSIVTAHVNGLFDKRGLDPLMLVFYFSSRDNKAVQLIILRNQSSL